MLAARPWNRHKRIPFAGGKTFDTQAEVPDALAPPVTGANDREPLTLGVGYLPIPQIAIQLEAQNFDNQAHTATDQVNLGVGWSF